MASTSTKPRAQGGGRKANSEPRQQVFKEFNGCNFELATHDYIHFSDEQSDLAMNYMVIQDNAGIASNKTIETRNNLRRIMSFHDPDNPITLSGVCLLVKDELYTADVDGRLFYCQLGSDEVNEVEINDVTGNDPEHHWTSLCYVDDQLVGLTEENMMWTGPIGSHTLENAKHVDSPISPSMSNITAIGDLDIVENGPDSTHPYRIAFAYAYVNKYGPTACSNQKTFYANIPLEEWHSGQYAVVWGAFPSDSGIEAVEVYYNVGNASTLLFAGRTDHMRPVQPNMTGWYFDWLGYVDPTSAWPMANLIAPVENLTDGVPASYMAYIDSRMYFWGDASKPYRLWIGGNPGNLLSVSPGTGGGFVDVEPGTSQEIKVVTKYKTQSGNSIVTMLCDSPNSTREQRFNLVENSVALSNEQSMKSWQAEQVAGAVGCKSYRGAVVCEDGLYSVSRYGLALTTMTMEYNSQIRANYVSDAIKPVFTEIVGSRLEKSILLERDNVLYLAFGDTTGRPYSIDNLVFCYDIDLKAWWTISLDLWDEPNDILNMIHIDHKDHSEGIAFVTENTVYLLPLVYVSDIPTAKADFVTTIRSGDISTTQPQQNWFYLSQLEFRFDYLVGELTFKIEGIDQFGRRVETEKHIGYQDTVFDLVEYMRIDLRLQSYTVTIEGQARFRLTHFIAKVYTMSAKQGIVWGFDDSQSFRRTGDIHPTFKDYNDIRKAIIP